MNQNLQIRFRLKERKVSGQSSVLKGNSGKDALITMRIYYQSMRIEYSTGYRVDVLRWDDVAQCATGPSREMTLPNAQLVQAVMVPLPKQSILASCNWRRMPEKWPPFSRRKK